MIDIFCDCYKTSGSYLASRAKSDNKDSFYLYYLAIGNRDIDEAISFYIKTDHENNLSKDDLLLENLRAVDKSLNVIDDMDEILYYVPKEFETAISKGNLEQYYILRTDKNSESTSYYQYCLDMVTRGIDKLNRRIGPKNNKMYCTMHNRYYTEVPDIGKWVKFISGKHSTDLYYDYYTEMVGELGQVKINLERNVISRCEVCIIPVQIKVKGRCVYGAAVFFPAGGYMPFSLSGQHEECDIDLEDEIDEDYEFDQEGIESEFLEEVNSLAFLDIRYVEDDLNLLTLDKLTMEIVDSIKHLFLYDPQFDVSVYEFGDEHNGQGHFFYKITMDYAIEVISTGKPQKDRYEDLANLAKNLKLGCIFDVDVED
jgi:hypothetical protein